MCLPTRRDIFRLTVLQFLTLAVALPKLRAAAFNRATSPSISSEDTSWEHFLELVDVQANLKYSPKSEEDYVASIERLAKTVRLDDLALCALLEKAKSSKGQAAAFSALHESTDYQVSLFTFDEWEEIPLHNHPEMTGVSICASGSLLVRQFDCLNDPGNESTRLRYIGAKVLENSNTSTVTSTHRNVHSVTARKPSQLIDIFTPKYSPDRLARTKWFTIDSAAILVPGQTINARENLGS